MFTRTSCCLLIFLLLTIPVNASSLWDSDSDSIFADRVARGEGDLLTVIIKENAKASHAADTKTSQGLGIELKPGVFLADFFAGLSPSYADGAESGGITERTGTIAGEITVQVVEVRDNGVLVIEGTKGIKVDREHQEIKLRGLVRVDDIEPDNTIDSARLADVSISYEGSGVIADKQRPSILEWLLNWLF